MIAAELLQGDVPPPAAIVEVLHPLTLTVAAAIVGLQLPDGWTATAALTPGFHLTDPDGRSWSVLLLNDVQERPWTSWTTPGVGSCQSRNQQDHETAQLAADATVASYRAGIAAVAS